jgi:hypothetical protein
MTLSEYFNKGRAQELEYEKRKASRQPQRRNVKLPWYSPAGVIIGAGVFYQMSLPILNKTVIPVALGWKYLISDAIAIMKSDAKVVAKQVTHKVDPDWEKYKRFTEMCEGKK